MISALLDRACRQALTDYVNDPWRWARETDLVVDLVQTMKLGLSEREQKVPATLEELGTGLHDMRKSPRLIPRIRTELKLVADESHDESAGRRVDIGIFRDQEVHLYFNHEGARDVNLKARQSDMAGLLEIKLFPDKYLFREKHPCRWFGDVMKLEAIASEAVRGVLLVDTSLPLEGIGVSYAKRRGVGEPARARESPTLPRWPIRPGMFTVEVGDRTATLEPTDAPTQRGIHLWALAVDPSWKPALGRLLPHTKVIPQCWRVQIA